MTRRPQNRENRRRRKRKVFTNRMRGRLKFVFGCVMVGFGVLGAKRLIAIEGSFPNGLLPVSVIFTVIVVALMHWILTKTVFGRHVYAAGSNKDVAHLAGINVQKVTVISHILCGICASFAGVVTASKLQNGSLPLV